jgi:chemotaxis protein CheD
VRLVVGVAEMQASQQPGDIIVTHALGSCLGIAVYDPVAKVGGLLHAMMPLSEINAEKAQTNPYMFIDTGVPTFFRELYALGGNKNRMVVKVAGGANVHDVTDHFAIGKRNYVLLKRILWKNDVLIRGEDVGGKNARTMYLEIGSGRVWISAAGQVKDL